MNDHIQSELNSKASMNLTSYRCPIHAAKAGGIVPPNFERSSGRLRQSVLMMLLVTAMTLAGLLSVEALADESHSNAAYNTYCPVTTSELAEDDIYVDWEGQRIHFCCTKCKRDFLVDPDRFRENLIAVATKPVADKMAHYAEEAESVAAGHNTSEQEDQHDHDHTLGRSEQIDSAGDQNRLDAHAASGGEEHDHAIDHGNELGFVALMGKLHPLVIHFPIALVIMSAVFMASYLLLKQEIFTQMAIITMYWAALLAVIAALLGLARGIEAEFPSFLLEYFEWHRLVGLIATGITVLTAILGYRWRSNGSRKSAIIFGLSLAANVIAIGITGHLGATLVYGPDYFE